MIEGPEFRTTHWSVVLAAGHSLSNPSAQQAFEILCSNYWWPLYAFVRRQGHSVHEAEDLTQQFFGRLIEKNPLDGVSADKGRFRSFLLGAMKHFLSNEWRRERAQKRGGGCSILSISGETAEALYLQEASHHATPETIYERSWATTVLKRVMDRLCRDYANANKIALFEELKEFLSEKKSTPHEKIAEILGMSVGAVAVSIHRLRQRYRELLRDEIAQTISSREDVDDEIRYLISVLGS